MSILKVNAGQCNKLQSVFSMSLFIFTNELTPVICENVGRKSLTVCVTLTTNADQCNCNISSYRLWSYVLSFIIFYDVTAQISVLLGRALICGELNAVYLDALRFYHHKSIYFCCLYIFLSFIMFMFSVTDQITFTVIH